MKSKLLMVLAAFLLLLSAPLAAQVPEDNELRESDTDVDIDAEIEPDGDLDVEAEINGDADTSADDDALFEDEADYDADDRELPRTASPLPLLALLGAGSLVSALGLRIRRK